MKKEEFFDQLEYLLQDIAEEEKREAIDYYKDYLDEAGADQEETVLTEFGSPERIAAIIRTDLLGGMETSGEFTEHGYADPRFETSALPVIKKTTESHQNDKKGCDGNNQYEKEHYEKGNYAKNSAKHKISNWIKYPLIAFLALVAVPTVCAIALGAFSGVLGVGSALLAVFLLLAALTALGLIGGFALIVIGATQIFFNTWIGILCAGLGVAFMGLGCLLLVCSILFYGTFIPWAVTGTIGIIKKTFGKKENKAERGSEQ